MDDELRKILNEQERLLRESLDLQQENSRRIKKLERHARRTMLGRIIYWAVIIAIPLGLFYFVKPYIDATMETYNSVRNSIGQGSQVMQNPVDLIQSMFKDTSSE